MQRNSFPLQETKVPTSFQICVKSFIAAPNITFYFTFKNNNNKKYQSKLAPEGLKMFSQQKREGEKASEVKAHVMCHRALNHVVSISKTTVNVKLKKKKKNYT